MADTRTGDVSRGGPVHPCGAKAKRMSWLRRLLRWLFGPGLRVLEARASEHGRITLEQTDLETGLGWHAVIRPHGGGLIPSSKNIAERGSRPNYAWSAFGETIEEALSLAIKEADENPIRKIVGTECRPKLGGAEFDPE